MAQMTTLAAAITTVGQSSITITEHVGFPAAGAFSILIDSEVLRVTAGNGTTGWTVTRAYAGTTAATHSNGATVALVSDGSVINLGMAETYLGIPDNDDDGWLPWSVGAVNRAFLRAVGVDLGPSADTVRYYHGDDARLSRRRLTIPGGIRAFTAVSVSVDGGTTWTAVTSDVRLGPETHQMPPGEPYRFIEFKDPIAVTGSYSAFPTGTRNVKVEGTTGITFGWDDQPDDAIQACLTALQRLYADRQGRGGFPTETDAARYLNPATTAYFRELYFAGVA